ncbi:MAG: class I SAM-dependent methyltransferase [Bacillota bacterium]
MKRRKIQSKEVGLELGLIFGAYFLKSEYLHFGYWTGDLPLDIQNLARAQENYADFLISHIPEGVHTILDVGCGSGKLALTLVERGYEVDCVSPSSILTDHAKKLLGVKSRIFECYYEALQTDKRYDLILFSESFQYIPMESALENSQKFLNEGGFILICDFFKTDAGGGIKMGGGHRFSRFKEILARYALNIVKEIDITDRTAPNFDLVRDLMVRVGVPVWELILYYLDRSHPRILKFLKWKYRKKIDRMERIFFNREISAENFKIYQTYRLFLLKLN